MSLIGFARPTRARVALGVVVAAIVGPPAAFAAPPANDNFANASVIGGMPFTDMVTITEATTEAGEPIDSPYYQGRTVWYSIAPADDVVVRFDPGWNWGAPFMVVYRADGAGFAGLTRIASDHWSSATVQTLRLEGGTTYYVQGGDRYAVWGMTSTFSLTASVVPPPPNDHFADAIAFSSVPFSDHRDLTAATVEPGEPGACGSVFTRSAWYAFTPTVSGSYGAYGVSNVNVYTGATLGDLTSVACAEWPGLYFYAEAGRTYYLQTYGGGFMGGGVSVDVVPPPAADFRLSPTDPSSLEETQFSYWIGGYWDPTVNGWAWDFGDGGTASGETTSHRFESDGDFTVTLTVSARGGRTATATKIVSVRTHDVAVLSLVTPDKGKVDKPTVITVGVGNTRYQESVRVDLYRVTPQGDVLIGTHTQDVGVMRQKKTVEFAFEYVFTSADAALAKVPFKAVATIEGARDAMPSDNQVVSPPTLVTG